MKFTLKTTRDFELSRTHLHVLKYVNRQGYVWWMPGRLGDILDELQRLGLTYDADEVNNNGCHKVSHIGYRVLELANRVDTGLIKI